MSLVLAEPTDAVSTHMLGLRADVTNRHDEVAV
jgi:hypothetical protein